MPKDFGSFVFACHIYYPAPVHIHMPLEISSDEQLKIYKWLFQLRSLGFKDGVLIFERGGGQTPLEFIKTTVFSLREVIKNLDKDIPFEKLPMEFFGVSREGFFSEQRQMTIVRDHARDPLKGLLMVPEEEYTTLGRAAIEKGKRPEEWEKEKLR